MTLTDGTLVNYGTQTPVLTVTGAATIADGATIGGTDTSSAMNFGSVTIADGGTFIATSGTTKITGVSDGSGYCFKNLEGDGTGFVHNNGHLLFDPTSSDPTYISTGYSSLNDVTIDANATGQIYYILGGGGNIVIDGNLDIIQGYYQQYTATNTLTVHGNTYVRANAEWNDASAVGRAVPSGTQTHHGLVTIESGPQFDLGSGTNNFNGGIRNLGGTIN